MILQTTARPGRHSRGLSSSTGKHQSRHAACKRYELKRLSAVLALALSLTCVGGESLPVSAGSHDASVRTLAVKASNSAITPNGNEYPYVALDKESSASITGRRLSRARQEFGGRPGEGKWWWVSDVWGSKREHMVAAGYTSEAMKGLLFLDDSDPEAEAAGCFEPINIAQWSKAYQMHYMHFQRETIDEGNKGTFLNHTHNYIKEHEIHTVILDWDKTITAVEDWSTEVSGLSPEMLNPAIIEFISDERASHLNLGIATYNRFKESGKGEDMVDFHIAHASLRAALNLERLVDRVQTWTCWGRDDPIIVVDLKKYEASITMPPPFDPLPMLPGFQTWWNLTDRVGNKRQHMLAAGFTPEQMQQVLYIDSSDKAASSAWLQPGPQNKAMWSDRYGVHYLHYKPRLLNSSEDKDQFIANLLDTIENHGIQHVILEFVGTLVPWKFWAGSGLTAQAWTESVDNTLTMLIGHKDVRDLRFGIATYNRLVGGDGTVMSGFHIAYQTLSEALRVKELTTHFSTWTCWGKKNPIIEVNLNAFESMQKQSSRKDDISAMAGSAHLPEMFYAAVNVSSGGQQPQQTDPAKAKERSSRLAEIAIATCSAILIAVVFGAIASVILSCRSSRLEHQADMSTEPQSDQFGALTPVVNNKTGTSTTMECSNSDTMAPTREPLDAPAPKHANNNDSLVMPSTLHGLVVGGCK